MTIKALYPNVRPTLNLDFAKTKALDPRVTFTRASTATFVGSNGLIQTAASGAARFDHNPETGESLGLLVEEARTNSVLNSINLSPSSIYGGANGGSYTFTPNQTTAPDGTNTAGSIVFTTSHCGFAIRGTGVSSTTITVNLFAKYIPGSANTHVRIQLSPVGGGSNYGLFNLTNGTFSVNSSVFGVSMTPFPNGWYRCSVTATRSITWSQNGGDIRIWFHGATPTETPINNTDGTYIWGVQLEAGAFPTSYIPTSGSTVTRAADVATLANTGSSIFPVSAFTTVNSPFGTAGGGTTVKLVGPTVKRTAVYASDLTQAQINALASVNDEFWRWRVLGSSFALPSFTTDGSVTVDWGDGVVETLTTAVHTFTNGGGYHDIGFRLNSGTFFKPYINNNATYKDRVIALGPAPASMKINAATGFYGCSNFRGFDATVDVTGGTDFSNAWNGCSSLTSFPLINTAAGNVFQNTWRGLSALTSFPLINTAAGTNFNYAWKGCSSLTSFPLIDTAAGTNFQETWDACSGLTSFPLINTAAGTSFSSAWRNSSSLTSFPPINTAAGTNFQSAWQNCSSLTSFPLINTGSGTNFQSAWQSCSSLTSFPANMFDTTGTLVANAFSNAFAYCALTAASIENILTSLVTNGRSNIALGLQGGTNAGASTWTTAANTAYATLISRGWTISRNA